ncbi:MAG: DUF4832 domain-containing protein [Clostridia bacterium]|nr:DUF4832 domain-containing protein [Clostridia bacterium]
MKNNAIHRTARVFTAGLLAVVLLLTVSCQLRNVEIHTNEFTRTEAVIPNPMKGFASFYGKADQNSSMEYLGIKFNEIYRYENGQGQLDSAELDKKLAKIAERGNSAILRVYILNPGHVDSEQTGLFLPGELYSELKSAGDIYSNSVKSGVLEYPDFNSEKLIGCMTDFIVQFAGKYDGHPTIATIQMGLYGSWGEWNMSECRVGKCQMTNENLRRIIETYVSSFKKTKLMGRNPSLGYANQFPIGYHDDNYMFNTSDFHTRSREWKNLLRKQDYSYGTLQQFYDFINGDGGKYPPLWDIWQTQMFGGELSMQMYLEPFGPLWSGTEREALDYCIHQFHMSWLMGVGVGGIPDADTDGYKEFRKVAGSFGYDIYIDSVTGKNCTSKIVTSFGNAGVAPFYYDWKPEYLMVDPEGSIVYTYTDEEFLLSALLPDETAESVFFIPDDLKAGEYSVQVRFVNPAEETSKKVLPLRLSNDHEIREGIYELASVIIE